MGAKLLQQEFSWFFFAHVNNNNNIFFYLFKFISQFLVLPLRTLLGPIQCM